MKTKKIFSNPTLKMRSEILPELVTDFDLACDAKILAFLAYGKDRDFYIAICNDGKFMTILPDYPGDIYSDTLHEMEIILSKWVISEIGIKAIN